MISFRRVGYLAAGTLLAAAFGASLLAQAPNEKAKAPPPRELQTVNLAAFQLANGNEVRILGVPEEKDIMVGELVNVGPNEKFVIEPNTPPAEVFRRLAPKDSPVPRMIAESDDKKVLAGRKVIESLDQPIDVPMERLGLKAGVAPQAPRSGAGSCQSGSAGAEYFKSNHCDQLGGPG